MSKTPALVSYFGGKNSKSSLIYPVIPKDFKIYLEPFSGSFGVYFFLDTMFNVDVRFNDINKDQTNLVACSKDYINFYSYLKNALEDTNNILYCKETDEVLIKKYYKELYYSLKNSNFRNETFNIPDMKRASQYAFLLTSAFSSCSYTAAGFSGFKLMTFLRKLQNPELQNKLNRITSFETLDFEEVIKKYDSENTFIYLDPPYNTVEKKKSSLADQRSGWYGTKNEFGQEDHTKLLELLKTTKSRWALSYYYFDELELLLPKDKYVWIEKDFFRSSASFSENKSTKGTEVLILNYDPNLITNITPISEKNIDEIEEENDGAFINSNVITEEEKNIINDFTTKFISSQKDIDPEIAEVINKPGFFEKLLEKENDIKPEVKEDEIDDFWN